ncbi:hypothetical protein CP98_01295 [Sphingobium yanoikuyae]|uniref:PilZ domain-containing protein n=1 Tax=Sphingobium yanoikuyae TaxID=13690 RepID=A0A084EQ48_SPHYA|nr:hypothetical protein [Sphingobium yanoikuyae]KEZ20090.1 hypothetical protein CP98_01295 [Sphingobium yanoikuyae]
MAISVLLMIDGGSSLNDVAQFEVKPERGEIISFWKGGRDLMEATVVGTRHQQTEHGYVYVVEAETSEQDQLENWIASYKPSTR